MNKISKIVVVLMTLMISTISVATAYDSSDPFTCTLQWIIPTDTTFTVTFAGSETSVDFSNNVVGQTHDDIEPDSQNASLSVPIIVVENVGNQALNFSCNLTAAKPSWANLKVNDVNSNATATVFNATAVQFATNIAVSSNTSMYIWTNFTNAALGTTTRTLQINSE